MPIENLDPTATYAMNVVTRLTGLAADTIRAWERRYKAVVPQRTQGKTRRYSVEDVQKLILLKEATSRGYRIAMVAGQSTEELAGMLSAESALAAQASENSAFEQELIAIRESYFEAIERFDTGYADSILHRVLAELGQRDFLYNILLPIMRETGDRWVLGTFTVAHEHVISVQMRNMLEAFLRSAPASLSPTKIVIGTPSGHRHEFGALAAAMLASLRGFQIVYVGMDMPADDLAKVIEVSGSKLAILSVVRDAAPDEERRLADDISSLCEVTPVWLGCPKGSRFTKLLPKARCFHEFESLERAFMDLL